MRIITDHVVNPVNDRIQITATDEPGPGGANHDYKIELVPPYAVAAQNVSQVNFQKGGITEAGLNGVTQEALLAIVIDRLRCFQAGPFACRENAIALTKCEEALHWLQSRTRARMARGVEGRSVA